MAATDLEDSVLSNAQGPREARADGVHVRQHSIAEQIRADRYSAAKDAVCNSSTKRTFGIRMGVLVPPGACPTE